MAQASAGLHESIERLKAETVDRHRAIVSLMEELEAIDWYDQRVDAAGDDELRAIPAHNRDEEKEHAAMVLEWLRRHDPQLDAQLRTYLSEALQKLRGAGIGGPYVIALGPRCYTGLGKTLLGGFPVLEHLRRLVDGAIVSAPAVDGAVVLSTRGGDFELTVGQDFSIGYLDHTADAVRLYLQESFTFRLLSPEAAVPLANAS
jgi:hypothetical protein